ncbi:amidase [Brucella intermedia]|uniref:amidase n=1 Tax=Brucella intermedia TaxID=94625 RepID=UPI00224B148D|nr:amidase [Brucella intermedia]
MSISSSYDNYDATDLAELVSSKEVSALELLDATIEKIEELNPVINAVVHKFYDKARAQIEAGLPDGPFSGVPFTLKDIGADYEGTPCWQGSRLFQSHVSRSNSTLVNRYLSAGLVILGKSSTSEFALVGSVENELHGPTRNPWNTDYSSGGSSGGAAAIVGSRMMPIAHASDGGGSIRLPSSWCGVFGFKPSRGRSPFGPKGGEGIGGLSTHNCITRSVRDSAALLDVIAGPDVGDPYAAPTPERPFREEVGAPVGKLRIGIMTSLPDLEISEDSVAAAETGARICEALGHSIEPVMLPFHARPIRQLFRDILAINMDMQLRNTGAARGRPVTEDEVEPHSWLSAQAGVHFSGADYLSRIQQLHALGRAFGPYFEKFDVIITPTTAQPPQPLGVIGRLGPDLDAMHEKLMECFPFTQVYNMSGLPAMSMPLYRTNGGLPIGVQFAAGYGRDGLLYRLAAQIEEAAPWAQIQPGVSAPAFS